MTQFTGILPTKILAKREVFIQDSDGNICYKIAEIINKQTKILQLAINYKPSIGIYNANNELLFSFKQTLFKQYGLLYIASNASEIAVNTSRKQLMEVDLTLTIQGQNIAVERELATTTLRIQDNALGTAYRHSDKPTITYTLDDKLDGIFLPLLALLEYICAIANNSN